MFLFRYIRHLLICSAVFSGLSLAAQVPERILEIHSDSASFQTGSYNIKPYLYLLADSAGTLDIETVASGAFTERFEADKSDQLTNYTPGIARYWLRLTLRSHLKRPEEWLTSFNLGRSTQYMPQPDGSYEAITSGVLLNLSERYPTEVHGTVPFLPLVLHKDSLYTVYWQVEAGRFSKFSSLNTWDNKLSSPSYVTRFRNGSYFFDALVMGMILAIGLYQLAIFFFNRRERQYLLLAFQSMGLFLILFFFRCYALELIFPQSAAYYFEIFEFPVTIFFQISISLFTWEYLNLRQREPRLYAWSIGAVRAYIVLLLLCWGVAAFSPLFWKSTKTLFALAEFVVILFSFVPLITAEVRGIRAGFRPAINLMIATLLPIAGLIVQILINFAFPHLIQNYDFLAIGFACMELMLAIGLAEKIRDLQLANEQAQQERIQAEAQQRIFQEQVNEQLRIADRLKDQFLANTSHELRTPLNGIIGLAETLHDGVAGPLNDEVQANLRMIASSGRRLASLVDDLLDFSRLKNEAVVLHEGSVDLHSLTELVLRISAPLVGDRKVLLKNEVSPDLPPALGDENRIQQILHNLVGNAIKFTHTGEVSVKARQIAGGLEVEVKDTGIGIPADRLDSIFAEFEQGDGSISREYGGTGLGLTITQKLVELHHGRIWVESEPQKGSSFFFTLPQSGETIAPHTEYSPQISRIHLLPQAIAPEVGRTETPEPAYSGAIRILIVDDEPVNIQVLKNHLSRGPYQLFTATNGREALDMIAQQSRFDLVLLDIMMPRMSGYEVCQRIRETYLPSELPVLMITAKNQIADLVEGLYLGANDYLPKPFSREELLARIKNQLTLSHIYEVTQRFVPKEFIRSLGYESIMDIRPGDQVQQEMVVMFVDIRDFTTLAERLSPEETFRFVVKYVQLMGPLIRTHKGFIIQQYGDGIMALFPDSGQALRCSVEMQKAVETFQASHMQPGDPSVRIGIGLHRGPLIMGIIGDEVANSPSTISDTVNAAARMEGLTKYFGARVLFTDACAEELSPESAPAYRFLGRVRLKGKQSPTDIYECFGGDPEEEHRMKQELLPLFMQGMEAYAASHFPEAAAHLEKVLEAYPGDLPARFLLDRIRLYIREGVPEGWQGVDILTFK